MKNFLLFVTIIALSFSQTYADKTATTFVLSNEGPGHLIDDLIAGGYGNGSLFEALLALEPASGGVISYAFLETLAHCPPGSEIFTQKLNDYAEFDGALAVNTDGTIHPVDIFGKDCYQKTGYQTYPKNIYLLGAGHEVFTSAAGPETFIDAGSAPGGGRYQAFAIAWSLEHNPTTFVLTNEGGLIDELIASGYGDTNLYQALAALQGASNGVIPEVFMETLANCPAGSEIFTARLTEFAGQNNPVCINADGTLGIRTIFGHYYYGQTGYGTYPEDLMGEGREIFTYATGPEYFIDAGSAPGGGQYSAFAIAWAINDVRTFVLSNELGATGLQGGLIDQLIAAGHGNDNLYEVLQFLAADSASGIPADFVNEVGSNPSGSEVFTTALNNFAGLNNPVCINADGTLGIQAHFGRDYDGQTGYTTETVHYSGIGLANFTMAQSETYYIDAGESYIGHYQAIGIAWSKSIKYDTTKTIILSNEMGCQSSGGLLDMLVSEGYGNSSLFDVLQLLQPHSQEVINTEFMNLLAKTNYKDVFEAPLQNFADSSNNPIGIGENGMLIVAPVYGRDLMGKPGFNTISYNRSGTTKEMFTYATSPEFYIDAGVKTIDDTSTIFKAYAVIWVDTITTGIYDNLVEKRELIISPNPASEYIEINLDRWSPSEIKIYNTFGENVINYEFRISNYNKTRIDISRLPNGMYFLNCGGNVKSFIISK